MADIKFNNISPDNIMSKGQQVDRIYSKGTLVWEYSTTPVFEEVTIGTQTWMAVNLDIDDGLGGIYAYNNDEANVSTYGRLYTWDAAMRVAVSIDGWHLPTDAEWTILENYLIGNGYNYDGTKDVDKVAKSLCAKTNWAVSSEAGTPGAAPENNNSTGFTALPGGYRLSSNGYFNLIGESGDWWSSTEHNEGSAYYRYLYYYNKDLSSYSRNNKGNGFSVRLIRD